MGILSIVAIQKAHPLLSHVLFLDPELYKFGELVYIHKLNIVDMSILLSLYKHAWGDAFVAHGLGIGLMAFAVSIHLVSDLRRSQAVSALDFRRMDALAFEFSIRQVLVERNMGGVGNKLFIQAVGALGVGAMLAHPLHGVLLVLEVHLGAVQAAAPGTMTALWLVFLFGDRALGVRSTLCILFGGGCGSYAVEAFAPRRMVAFGGHDAGLHLRHTDAVALFLS